MDDWGNNMYQKGWLGGATRKAWEHTERRLVADAQVAIGICEEMSRAYEQRYDRRWESLGMPVDMAAWEACARRDWVAGPVFRIRYGGRIGWAIQKCIVAVACAVDHLCREGRKLAFEVRTFQPQAIAPEINGLQGVTVGPPEPYANLPKSLATADALLIPYDFDAESFRKARYSMTSKLADCMASGTPCLVYGAAGLPVVEYARREGWGLVVDDPSLEALKRAILLLESDVGIRKKFGLRARELVRMRHDAQIVAEQLRGLLAAAATQPLPRNERAMLPDSK
jgi:hypothetical protein